MEKLLAWINEPKFRKVRRKKKPKLVRLGDIRTGEPEPISKRYILMRLQSNNHQKQLPTNKNIIRGVYSEIY